MATPKGSSRKKKKNQTASKDALQAFAVTAVTAVCGYCSCTDVK